MPNNQQATTQDWLVIANGVPLSHSKLAALCFGKKILVLDGAYHYADQLNIKPDVLIGDFDSIDPNLLDQAQKTEMLVEHLTSQETTDLEKGLHYLLNFQNRGNIYICGATGLRLDHTLFNLRILKKFHHLFPALVIVTEEEIIRYAKNSSIKIKGTINDGVSLLGFPKARVNTTGLKFDVTNFDLEFALQESISNALIATEALIEIQGEALIIHRIVNNRTCKNMGSGLTSSIVI